MITPAAPDDHRPTEVSTDTFDVIVIGAGSTGENIVSRAAAGGLTVAVIEAELVGGECSYWACMPSKALLRGTQALGAARAVDGAKQAVTGAQDVARTLARRDSFNSAFDDAGQVQWVESTGATLLRGSARLAGEKQVSVTGVDGTSVTLTARHAVALAVGSTAAIPPIDGLDQVDPWDNRNITSAEAVPDSLIVIGGGPVGSEMADAWHAFGSTVTLIEGAPRLLVNLEPEAGERLGAALAGRGVDVRTGTTVTAVRRDGTGGPVTVTLEGGDQITATELLVAVGRRAATSDIGLPTVGLTDGAPLEVDPSGAVTAVAGGWLYAAGDCTSGAKLTHMGKYSARICGDAILARATGTVGDGDTAPYGRLSATAEDAKVPAVVFTTPEVAAVGLSEQQARDAGLPVRAVDYEIGSVAGASLFADGYDGWAKLVVDTDRDVIIGATFVGPDVAELLHAATIAVVGEVPLPRLWHAVPSYPTISEIWLRLLETWGM